MKIVVLMGSPNNNGSSAHLAENFIRGAQLKTLINRFCAFNGSIQGKHMKSALLSVAWNNDSWTFEALEAHYGTLVKYLNLEDCGMVLGKGCGTLSMTQRSQYPERAYRLGGSLV